MMKHPIQCERQPQLRGVHVVPRVPWSPGSMKAIRTMAAVVGAVALGLSALLVSPAAANAAGGPEVVTDT